MFLWFLASDIIKANINKKPNLHPQKEEYSRVFAGSFEKEYNGD